MKNTDAQGTAPQYPIQAVDKALRMLLLFTERAELRLSDAHTELGIGKSRAHRLLAMLVYHGFVVQDPGTKVYRPGPALMEIGLTAVRRMNIRELARPVLKEIAASTGETVHLGILEGRDVRFVDCVESELALRVTSRVGRVLPAYATSLGKALLAGLPREAVLDLYDSESLPPVTVHSIRRRSELLSELERVRARGYALNDGESEDGVSSVGVAIPRGGAEAAVAISVAAPSQRLDEAAAARAGELIIQAASRLQSAGESEVEIPAEKSV